MKQIIDSTRVPLRLWLDIADVEQGALDQAKNLGNYPFAYNGIAIMPDTHQGYGMPIGGVLPTQEVIVPNAVGVDIGAVDKETEVLTKDGWIFIDKYKEQEVLVWDDYEKTSFFSKPLLYIVKPCEDFTEYKSKYGLDQVLSDEHRMLVYEGYGKNKRSNTYFSKDFREKLLQLKKQDYYSVRTTFPTAERGVAFTDEELALRVMVSADGHIRRSDKFSTSIELHFRKQRKIDRSKLLLENAGVDYKEYKHKDKTVSINFVLNWYCDKDLTDLFACNQHQAKIIFDEYLYWDGSEDVKRKHKNYISTSKRNADLIQYICAVNGVRAGIQTYADKNNRWKDYYTVYQTRNSYVGFVKPKRIKIKNGKKYCFIVTTGYFVARRNGKIFVTGNCGMVACRTSLDSITPEQIKQVFGGSRKYQGGIRSTIPIGFKHHSKRQSSEYIPELDRTKVVENHLNSAEFQVGTLGGGNHFIEIQQGNDGKIWLMIHSGSRNIGLQIAKYYNDLAKEMNKKWRSEVPISHDLAFLPLDSQEGQDYITDMRYGVEFALQNRLLMMKRFQEAVNAVTGADFEEIINKPHNFAEVENHFGKNVWIHRKGATRARKDEIGMIPGSQGTKSYIVKGKGEKLSFTSCSHGAGRVMSRNKAKNELNLEHEIQLLDSQGIIHGIRHKNDLDEAPSVYKDIEEVISNQDDLIEVLVELSPLGVVKG